ncbi:hydroxymethylbilane synthase [Wolbachia endosymbiont of Pentidionis agamae]|uniref:hydroxymethylbilane synthase n=1 Tax=Wolbachia endosymbiont of Pentidionis agamae TaxID=3110435 RepID=UPI002FD0BA1D
MLIRIGTRKSDLAVAQALEVKQELFKYSTNFLIKIIKITTSGDKYRNVSLTEIGGKGLFIKEIENELLNNNIDIAVHSLKDVPAFFANGLTIPCVLKRSSPYDIFISSKYGSINSLPYGATVGTSSIRRKMQLLHLRPDLNVLPLRGNVVTRLQNKDFDGIILAEAGLLRLGKHNLIKEVLSPEKMLSAVGQGTICVQCRKDDIKVVNILKEINDRESFVRIKAERSFMKTVNGSCFTPMAALAEYVDTNVLRLRSMLANGNNLYFNECISPAENAEEMGVDSALRLKINVSQ